ncbi:DNA-binding transcriptional regulator of sugar metabolism, DeoR/GlpR family [Nakamurella panacisegetis]|uniref:DNA-binding transcriptional regulator of sugar metabolism, DeoR/GlpR family n=1 Tax=Nakamurella panacisegetis TaxID=1090615 RepID=A0A1H0K1K3_9ACTN|nr:DeoR/GlpR family DNA-binding transcription regulator [Nakamurella panacisegetis]SDO49739.1 DNA-binding transcriptional regulator of sugar metabolism, DeoR/GlpR family [Nakamurella panacisegetis]
MPSLDEFAREQAILNTLNAEGRVVVNDLAAEFGVSAVTVRKDLEGLERRSMLRRVRGGAVSVGASDEGAFEMRLRHSRDVKQRIARSVAPMVRHGDVIALDSSTTCYYLAKELLDRRDLVVVTNALRLAMLLMEQSSAMVLMPGGVLRRSAGSMVGPIGDVLTGRGRINKGFFGVVAISTVHGLMDLSAEEAQTKQFMARACDQVYGVFDSSKVDGFGLHSFASVGEIDAMFTDDGMEPAVIAQWGALGVPVHVSGGSTERPGRRGTAAR